MAAQRLNILSGRKLNQQLDKCSEVAGHKLYVVTILNKLKWPTIDLTHLEKVNTKASSKIKRIGKSVSQRRMRRETEKPPLTMIDEEPTDGTSTSKKDQDGHGMMKSENFQRVPNPDDELKFFCQDGHGVTWSCQLRRLIPVSHPSSGQLLSGHESHFQAILAPVLCHHRCSQFPQRRGGVPISGGLLGQQWPCLHQSPPPVFSSPPLSQGFRTASEQGPSVPMGALSQEYDTATSYRSSAPSPQKSPDQFLEAYQDPAKWE